MVLWLYPLASALCIARAWGPATNDPRRASWRALSVTLVGLFLLRWFELPPMLTDSARNFARNHGLYADRRAYQIEVVAILFILGGLMALAMLVRSKGRGSLLTLTKLALLGLTLYLCVRAVSLHHLDVLLSLKVFEQPVGLLIEGTFLIVINGAVACSAIPRFFGSPRDCK